MKFYIKRTSLWDGQPYGGAVEDINPKQPWLKWSIEINSLEELLALVAKEGDIVLSDNTIEIYDSYRE